MYETSIAHFADLVRDKAAGMREAPWGFFVGAMLAGGYIGIAMILALSASAGLDPGVRPLVRGAVFGLGLILTVFAGAELFTGYTMYLGFGLARRSVTAAAAAVAMPVVWVGNLAGSLILTGLFAVGGGGAVFADGGEALAAYAGHKADSGAVELLARAALCNWLVCLSIWTAARVKGDAAKCVVLAWILFAFVAAGFEHSVANMTALSLGLFQPGSEVSWVGSAHNLLWVTLGNVIGGAVFVVGGYLAAAKTDPREGAPRHDCGPLPASSQPIPAPPAAPAAKQAA